MILASKSPRRFELLKEMGYEFKVKVSDVDENIDETDPVALVEKLSLMKAKAVFEENEFIIASDTIVVLDNKIYGKPKNEENAFEMIKKLSGRTHNVISGLCVIYNKKIVVTHDITEVSFKEIQDGEIIQYIETREPMDKAGAYAIQGIGKKFVKSIKGSYNNVIGLPTEKLTEILKTFTL